MAKLWSSSGGGTGLEAVVDDPSPELGGDLDVLDKSIVSSANRPIFLNYNGDGNVGTELSGSLNVMFALDGGGDGGNIEATPGVAGHARMDLKAGLVAAEFEADATHAQASYSNDNGVTVASSELTNTLARQSISTATQVSRFDNTLDVARMLHSQPGETHTFEVGAGGFLMLGNDNLLIPVGTTAQRPGAPVNGDIRYNSDTDKFEGYQNGAWTDFISGGGGGSNIFGSSFHISVAGDIDSTNDQDFAVSWIPNQDMTATKLSVWLTNVGAGDTLHVGIYDAAGNKLQAASALSAALTTGKNDITIPSQALTGGTQYWVVLKVETGAISWIRLTNTGNILVAKEIFDAASSLPATLAGFFVSTKPPWIGIQ